MFPFRKLAELVLLSSSTSVGEWITFILIFKAWDGEALSALICFRIGTGGRWASLSALRKFQFP